MSTIAVIGAKQSDVDLLARLTGAGNSLLLFNSCSKEDLLTPVKKLDPSAYLEVLDCSRDACWEADAVLLLISESELEEVVKNIKDVTTQKQVGYFGSRNLSAEKLKENFPFSQLIDLDIEKFPSEENSLQQSLINDLI